MRPCPRVHPGRIWWFVGILAVVVLALAVVLARRGSTGGPTGSTTPGVETRDVRKGDSGLGGGGGG